MTFNWKHSAGAFALSVAMLASTGGYQAGAKPIETGQLLIKDKPVAKSGTNANDLCGIPYSPPCDSKAPSVDIETGQLLIKDKPVAKAAESTTTPETGDGAPVDAPSVDIELGQHLIRDKPTAATERRAHNGPGGTPPSTAKKGSNTGLILGITAAAAALAAVLASGNNDDRPTSP